MITLHRWSDRIESPEDNPICIGNSSDEVWKTKSGTEILVGDMSDAHIKNCYKMVRLSSTTWKKIFELEMKKRGLNIYEFV